MFAMVIAALVYICLPWYIQSAVWLVNLFIPDPVPFLDEIIMFVPIAYKIKRIFDISEFLGIGIIALTVCLTIR